MIHYGMVAGIAHRLQQPLPAVGAESGTGNARGRGSRRTEARPVVMDGSKAFRSANEAARAVDGFPAGVCLAASGKRASYKGHSFEYADGKRWRA